MKSLWTALSIVILAASVGFAQGVGAQAHGEGAPVNFSIGPPVAAFSTSDTFNGSNQVATHCVARSHGNPAVVIPVTSVTLASPGVFTTATNGFQGGERVAVANVSNVPAGTYQVVVISSTTFSLADPVTGAAVNTSSASTGGTVTTDAPLFNQPVWSILINTYSGSSKVRSSYVNGDTSMIYQCSNYAAASVGPYTLVQQIPSGSTCTSTAASPSFTCVMSTNITAGHRLFIMTGLTNIGEQFSSATGCSSTWTSIKKSTTDAYAEILYCSNATGGSTTVTITMNGNCGASPYTCSANVSEWSGGSGTVDQTNTAAAITNSPTTGSITTTVANELIMAMTGTGSTGTLSSGPTNSFTALVDNSTNPIVLFAYRIVSATGTYSTGWTLSGATAGWDSPIASFE